MTADEIRAWTQANQRARDAYYAEHIADAARREAKRLYDQRRYLERKRANA